MVQRRYFRTPVAVDTKSDASPVTIADREAEAVMRELIAANFPDHGILGEEHGRERIEAEFVWVLDPIDGTKAFITGRPLFGTLIAVAYQGRPLLGLIDQSVLQERWVGIAGGGAFWNGRPIHTRACGRLEDAVLSTTSPDLFDRPATRDAFQRLRGRVRLPIYGGDCYAYGQVALGLVDLVVECGLQPYDFMALAPVVEEAGGRMTDWQGRPLHLGAEGLVVAAGDAALGQAACDLLQPRQPG